MNISDEAVEAAFRELPDGAGVYVNRDDLREILEAAAPNMLAEAWEDGYKASDRDALRFKEEVLAPRSANPYRSQS